MMPQGNPKEPCKAPPAGDAARPGKSNAQMFWSFTKMGAVLIGGGYALLPLLEDEIVKRRGWAKSEEMIDLYALAQILPGVIAVNTCMLVGNRLRGWTGLLLAAAGITFVPFLLIAAYAAAYTYLRGIPLFEKVLFAVQAAVAGMILGLGVDMIRKTSKTPPMKILAGATVLATLFFDPSFAWLLIISVAAGLALWGVKLRAIR